MDACPGRLNEFFIFINRAGTFYGQCSEICGYLHAFMPIKLQSHSIYGSRAFTNTPGIKLLPTSKPPEPALYAPIVN